MSFASSIVQPLFHQPILLVLKHFKAIFSRIMF
jgi:hypothetical protein